MDSVLFLEGIVCCCGWEGPGHVVVVGTEDTGVGGGRVCQVDVVAWALVLFHIW